MNNSNNKRVIEKLRFMDLCVHRGLPPADRTALAKTHLLAYAETLKNVDMQQCMIDGSHRDYHMLRLDVLRLLIHLREAERAMEKEDWTLALREVRDIIQRVVFGVI